MTTPGDTREQLLAELSSFADELQADPGLGGAYDANMAAVDRIRQIIGRARQETDANGWTRQDDGIWTLPVEGGAILMSRQNTPEERAAFAEKVKRDGLLTSGSGTAKSLRQRITEAVHEKILRAADLRHFDSQIADAVLAVRDREMERLRGQIADLQRNNAALGREASQAGERRMRLAMARQVVAAHRGALAIPHSAFLSQLDAALRMPAPAHDSEDAK